MKIIPIKIILLVLLFINGYTYSQRKQIRIYSERSKESGGVTLFADNYSNENYTVLINFTKLENAQHGFSNPLLITVSPGKSTIMSIKKNNMKNGNISYNYKYSYRKGCLNTMPDTNIVYLIPTSKGIKTKIKHTKNLASDFGKKILNNWEFYSFSMNKGDTVYAARRGKIVKINNSDFIVEKKTSYSTERSSLKIIHNDCTYGQYINFDKFFVSVNEIVYPGQKLGIIRGVKGQNKATLMFGVYYYEIKELSNAKMESKTVYVSIKFDVNGSAQKLFEENTYKSVHRFETITQEMQKREIKKYKKQNGV